MATTSEPHKVCVMTSVHSAVDVRIFRKECVSLARAGFKVTLVAPWNRDERIDGVDIKAIPSTSRRLLRLIRTVWQLLREAKHVDAEIYHFHDPELIPVGLLLLRRGKTVIYDIHEDVPLDILSKHYLPGWSRRPLSSAFVTRKRTRWAWCIMRTTSCGARWGARSSSGRSA